MRNGDSQKLKLKVFTYSVVSILDIRLYFSDNTVLCGIKLSVIPVIVTNASHFEGEEKAETKNPPLKLSK